MGSILIPEFRAKAGATVQLREMRCVPVAWCNRGRDGPAFWRPRMRSRGVAVPASLCAGAAFRPRRSQPRRAGVSSHVKDDGRRSREWGPGMRNGSTCAMLGRYKRRLTRCRRRGARSMYPPAPSPSVRPLSSVSLKDSTCSLWVTDAPRCWSMPIETALLFCRSRASWAPGGRICASPSATSASRAITRAGTPSSSSHPTTP